MLSSTVRFTLSSIGNIVTLFWFLGWETDFMVETANITGFVDVPFHTGRSKLLLFRFAIGLVSPPLTLSAKSFEV